MNMRQVARKLHWILTEQVGLDPRKLILSLRGLPAYLRDLRRFRAAYRGTLGITPCLHDRFAEGGTTDNEYFWQDLVVARMVFAARPARHVDIGSRVDGFVAHVASFREIEVFDVRPITSTIPGVVFRQANLMQPLASMAQYCDSLSCLHALEHFGLGRYGDPVDPEGYRAGLANMAQILQPGGTFYLAVPVGQPRVEFNANRVFDPLDMLAQCRGLGLELRELHLHTAGQALQPIDPTGSVLAAIVGAPYGLGLFVFRKS
jgi:hypothetical protein